jgi:hypothetical protein
MKSKPILLAVVLSVLAAVGCSRKVLLPPRIDLVPHEAIGIVQFDCDAEGGLGALVTRAFTESARRDQGLLRMVEIGSRQQALGSVDLETWDAETFKALGAEHEVNTLFTGVLQVSDVRPDVQIGPDLRSGSVSASVDASLAVQLIETETGASIWSASARVTQPVAQVSVFGDERIVFDAEDPETAYAGLVESLVARVTQDFRTTRSRR